jgi:hypothetical protein
MKIKFICLVSVFILIFSMCLCAKTLTAETSDNEKDFIIETLDLPVQIVFDEHASFSTWFIIALAFVLPQQIFLTQYIARHEKSPPRADPAIPL